jgi:cbb3-type cytochrome oxidase subunit 3
LQAPSFGRRACAQHHAPRAGHETKVFNNATKAPSKRSTIERSVDKIIFVMFGLLFTMCIVGCGYFAWWTNKRMPFNWCARCQRPLPGTSLSAAPSGLQA